MSFIGLEVGGEGVPGAIRERGCFQMQPSGRPARCIFGLPAVGSVREAPWEMIVPPRSRAEADVGSRLSPAGHGDGAATGPGGHRGRA